MRRVRERGRRDAVAGAVREFRERRSAQVQPHFKKCFEAIDAVKFEPLEDVSDLAITQMISPEKEVVPMMTPVDPVDKSVEVWMVEVEDMMRLSVRHVMHLAIQDYAKQERTVLTQREK